MNGFNGKLLNVNLTDRNLSEEPIDENIARKFLGGSGYCCSYLYDKIDRNTDPLSPDNILMFMTGPFCGSNIPASGRFVVCAKSPLTGIWGESNCGGYFGNELKKAGYDGIIINGSSNIPVYLEITSNGTQIRDAASLWGEGIYKTSKLLKKKLGLDSTRVACIGQAGENLVKFASIGSEDKSAGRTGMGAVMGSKKLKAIAISAKKREYKAANPKKLKDVIKKAIEDIMASFASRMYGILGTSGAVDKFNAEG
ncbi:MAG: aldehyde ferredoxin oxidoreductase N-terminal domain-containing protein, partial [Candidatus Hermodarchaeota archaeon]